MNRPHQQGMIGFAAMALCVSGCTPDMKDQVLVFEGRTMGTTYAIEVVGVRTDQDAEKLNREITNILGSIDARMSTWRQDSELSRFNRGKVGEWQPVSTELMTVLSKSIEISGKTRGAFDPTVGRLVNLWGFGPAPRRALPPSDAAIKDVLASTGYAKLILDQGGKRARKDAAFKLDLSGIAKGYAVDQIAERLLLLGYTSYLVEVGGEIRSLGEKPGRVPWKIAIESPQGTTQTPETVLAMRDIAMATSGDYRNHFEYQGRRYAHILDPATGRPSTHSLVSVTVLATDTATADALATALLVMGPTRGPAFARAHNIRAYFISHQENGFVTLPSPAFIAAANY